MTRDKIMRPKLKSPHLLEIYPSAPECAMVCLRHPFESVARTIKQKRLANRDKNPAIFFYSLPRDRRATGGWLNSVRASTDKRQTPLSSSFVCFKRHLFGGLDELVASRDSRGVKRSSGGIRGERREKYGVAWLEKVTFKCHRKEALFHLGFIVPFQCPLHTSISST